MGFACQGVIPEWIREAGFTAVLSHRLATSNMWQLHLNCLKFNKMYSVMCVATFQTLSSYACAVTTLLLSANREHFHHCRVTLDDPDLESHYLEGFLLTPN